MASPWELGDEQMLSLMGKGSKVSGVGLAAVEST